jgi:hypothetical protein
MAEFTAVNAGKNVRKPPREHVDVRSYEKPGHARNASLQVCVDIPIVIVERIDVLIGRGLFKNRSDFIREAVRRLLLEYEKTLFREPQPVPGVR